MEGSIRSADVEVYRAFSSPVIVEGTRVGLERLGQRGAPQPPRQPRVLGQRQRAKAQPPPVPAGVR